MTFTLNMNLIGEPGIGRTVVASIPDWSTYAKWDDNDHPKDGKVKSNSAQYTNLKQIGGSQNAPNFVGWSHKDIQNIYQGLPYSIDRTYRNDVVTGDRITFTTKRTVIKQEEENLVPPAVFPVNITTGIDIPRDDLITNSALLQLITEHLGIMLDQANAYLTALRTGITNPKDVV